MVLLGADAELDFHMRSLKKENQPMLMDSNARQRLERMFWEHIIIQMFLPGVLGWIRLPMHFVWLMENCKQLELHHWVKPLGSPIPCSLFEALDFVRPENPALGSLFANFLALVCSTNLSKDPRSTSFPDNLPVSPPNSSSPMHWEPPQAPNAQEPLLLFQYKGRGIPFWAHG